mmetsp:Transcript_6747/g.11623  ORF Transcript_6747/g.11623 Transcript_6747/m.11623 type:complete len:318 (-) Transcript_6747:521-1474(-)|eukprot:CAMPEP_0198198070 /NCGR_PEP_ID=MMETSP1445-20131203/1578_1 /TAXON_ID=36898 /ORGANISM="Pyramimonas sp., Strain CCMP2087" /LENGTH=317 /DNA_ID=CAMNT_0043867517 /DNA_START=272 /DNA_END=1225 /DNA_ORIENTATION=+
MAEANKAEAMLERILREIKATKKVGLCDFFQAEEIVVTAIRASWPVDKTLYKDLFRATKRKYVGSTVAGILKEITRISTEYKAGSFQPPPAPPQPAEVSTMTTPQPTTPQHTPQKLKDIRQFFSPSKAAAERSSVIPAVAPERPKPAAPTELEVQAAPIAKRAEPAVPIVFPIAKRPKPTAPTEPSPGTPLAQRARVYAPISKAESPTAANVSMVSPTEEKVSTKMALKKDAVAESHKQAAASGQGDHKDRFRTFQRLLNDLFSRGRLEDCTVDQIEDECANSYASLKFTPEGILKILTEMEDQNKLMMCDGTVYRI